MARLPTTSPTLSMQLPHANPGLVGEITVFEPLQTNPADGESQHDVENRVSRSGVTQSKSRPKVTVVRLRGNGRPSHNDAFQSVGEVIRQLESPSYEDLQKKWKAINDVSHIYCELSIG